MFPVQDKRVSGTKFAGRSRAVVTENKDPQKRGRIKVRHPLVGETVWIPYLQVPGCFFVPDIGDIVYVEADCGYETHLVAWGNLVKGAEGSPETPEEFQRVNPTNKGFYTKGGHLIEIDDGEDPLGSGVGVGAKIQITTLKGQIFNIDCDSDTVDIQTTLGHEIKMDPSGGVLITTSTGTSATLSDSGIELKDVPGNTIKTSSSGIEINDINQNSVITSSSGIKASEVTGAGVNLSQGKVAIGGSTAEVVDILVQFLQELSTDSFSGFGAPAGKSAVYAQLATKLQTIKGSL